MTSASVHMPKGNALVIKAFTREESENFCSDMTRVSIVDAIEELRNELKAAKAAKAPATTPVAPAAGPRAAVGHALCLARNPRQPLGRAVGVPIRRARQDGVHGHVGRRRGPDQIRDHACRRDADRRDGLRVVARGLLVEAGLCAEHDPDTDVRAQRPGCARRWRAVERFLDGVAPRRFWFKSWLFGRDISRF